jgi:hypothetical protein
MAPASPPASSTRAETAVDALAFHLDYLETKLAEIGKEYAEDISTEHAHDLHSAWDEVQQARAALDRLRAQPRADASSARCPAFVDFDVFTARWDRASEPISALIGDKAAWAIAEWAAARAKYELVFVEAVRPAPASSAARADRLCEAQAELDRACKALRREGTSPYPLSAATSSNTS